MFCAHTQRTSGSIHCHVAAADNSHNLRLDDRCRILRVIAVHQVDTGQILICGAYAHQTFARNVHEPGQTCTGTDKDCIIAACHQFVDGQDLADDHIRLDIYAGILQRLDLLLYNGFRETELRNTVHQNAAGYLECLKDSYLIAQACQISGTGQTSRAAAYNGNTLAVRRSLFLLAGIAMLTGIVCHKTLQTADGNRFALLATDALALALVLLGTYTAADSRQAVGGADDVIRLEEVSGSHSSDEIRDRNAYRTSADAGLCLTVQTAGRLFLCLFRGIAHCNFFKTLCTFLGITLRHRNLCRCHIEFSCHGHCTSFRNRLHSCSCRLYVPLRRINSSKST